MNINKLNDSGLGYNVTIVTLSGNKIQGNIIKTDADMLMLKTEKGIVMINGNSIESIY